MMGDERILLTDGSVNPLSHIGYGAYLAVSDPELSLDVLSESIQVRRFENTSSTKLELQTLLWALGELSDFEGRVAVYTDSQNILSLLSRRERFEHNDYRSKKNRRLNNDQLYREFFRITDSLNCTFVKVRGHQVSDQKNEIDRLFTLVDKASRKALREDHRNA